MESRDTKNIIFFIIGAVVGLAIILGLISLSDNTVRINKTEYKELLEYKEIIEQINMDDIDFVKPSELSEFEVIKIEVAKQFIGKDNILYYKSFVSEENNKAIYYVVYYGIDNNYNKHKTEIEKYINDISLSIKKEWVLWGYKDMEVAICVEDEFNDDYVYFTSINGSTDSSVNIGST